ncbi:MAG: 50S ribosomal protein L23 [Patescibacteria group bacterium]|nr:50S ribosomal protein L23 [Patescibacteria group bacterium]
MKHSSHILLSPRITEKGALLSQHNCWVFNVAPSASKRDVAEAVRAVYNVRPRKVTLAALPTKTRVTRGTNRMGVSGGGKKAYVYLKQGDTIEFA